MFLVLLLVTLGVAVTLSAVVARAFDTPIRRILDRLVGQDLASAWARYVRFAVLVVGISGGVRIYQLERYVAGGNGPEPRTGPLTLSSDRWVLEVYGTLIGTLQSIAWVLLVFFVVALVAYVVARGFEMRQGKGPAGPAGGSEAAQ